MIASITSTTTSTTSSTTTASLAAMALTITTTSTTTSLPLPHYTITLLAEILIAIREMGQGKLESSMVNYIQL
jgi:hypothetical protein